VPRVLRDSSTIKSDFCSRFPRLAITRWSIKSPWDDRYQCIAWAACRTNIRWWPVTGNPTVHWPPGAPLDDSVDAFVQSFAELGYERCTGSITQSSVFEFGYQKVAIYATSDHCVLHMARQHFFGKGWLSKCGVLEDIQHADLHSIEGDPSPLLAALGRTYGEAVVVLKRSWWSALTHLCFFRGALAAFEFWLYRRLYIEWDD
jgi:hypothetical protein